MCKNILGTQPEPVEPFRQPFSIGWLKPCGQLSVGSMSPESDRGSAESPCSSNSTIPLPDFVMIPCAYGCRRCNEASYSLSLQQAGVYAHARYVASSACRHIFAARCAPEGCGPPLCQRCRSDFDQRLSRFGNCGSPAPHRKLGVNG